METLRCVLFALAVCSTAAAPFDVPENLQTGCGGKPADVIFVLDASSSIWGPDFEKQVDFVRSVAAEFDLSADATRIGLLTFSDSPHTMLELDQYNDRYTTNEGISNTYQSYGGTNTDMALLKMSEMFLSRGRHHVPQIAIVLTDGLSDYPELTVQQANAVHQNHITVFAIGIGSSVDTTELSAIASSDDYVFSVDTFDALATIRETLAITACEVQKDEPDSKPVKPEDDSHINEVIKPEVGFEKGCDAKPADIVFCLDASGSIWGPDFERQLSFVQDIISVFHISPELTRIGLLTFGSDPMDWFRLRTYTSELDVNSAIADVKQSRGTTNTAVALMETRTKYFAPSEVRAGVVRVAVVITDGKSDNREQTRIEAQNLRGAGIHVFAVGVGEGVDKQELNLIASSPSHDYVFTVDNYAALQSIKKLLAMKTCQVTNPPTTPTTTTTTTTPPITSCGERRPADIVFGLPPSSGPDDINNGLNFIRRATAALEVGEDKVHIGFVPKECQAVPGFNLNDAVDKEDILDRLEGGYAAATTSEVIKYMRRRSFNDEHGARDNAQKFGVVVLKGPAEDRAALAREAQKARANNINLFVVVIGDDVPIEDIEAVASAPHSDYVLYVPSYSELSDVAEELVVIINNACINY